MADVTDAAAPRTGWQLRSLVRASGELELSLVQTPVAEPADDEILVRVEAAPVNPSDLALLVGPADLAAASSAGTPDAPVVRVPIAPNLLRFLTPRIDKSLPVGNEGAGTVVRAGSSAAARALLGRVVALSGGGLYTQYRLAKAADVLVLPDGTSAADGASSYVNPLTALGFVGTMRAEGHTAMINTAAASNLGQMLVRLCHAERIELINVVRSAEQARLLRDLGAAYVCDSSAPSFMQDLIAAIVATGATIGFDAIGGGRLAGQLLTAMEAALVQKATAYSPYGSTTHKQVYVYGGLDPSPTEFTRSFGLFWSIGGWLVTPYLLKIGSDETQRLRDRVAADLRTIFASAYTSRVSLAEALDLETLRAYARKATGQKVLIEPNA